jgi:DNA mismatch repair protein MutS
MSEADLTPLMRQYREIKRAYRNAILFFRVGDFYEMFYEDAEEASRLLSIALTSRDKGRPDPVPLCGVPFHAATVYIAKLLKAGRNVALCEQVEDPKAAKGLVRREVVRLYTPGTLTDTELLSPAESNYLVAVSLPAPHAAPPGKMIAGLAVLEPSTGEFWTQEFSGERALRDLFDECSRLGAKEWLHPDSLDVTAPSLSPFAQFRPCARPAAAFDGAQAETALRELFGVASLDGLGGRGLTRGLQAAGAILHYLRESRPGAGLGHLRRLRVKHDGHDMALDQATIRNLELLKPLGAAQADRPDATLLSVLDRTVSALGCRLLQEWIKRPLIEPAPILERLDAVEHFVSDYQGRAALRSHLRVMSDLSRLASRASLGSITPREMLGLKQSLAALPALRAALAAARPSLLAHLRESWDSLGDLHDLLDRALHPEAPATVREGGVIRDGYDHRLDEIRRACRDAKGWMVSLEAAERERTGIESLKVRFNQVFGYYIEITKANLGRVPPDFVRKQTLVNAERFTTPRLKELEDKVTGAELRLAALEQELYEALRAQAAGAVDRLQAMATTVATLDVIASLAEAAALYGYVRPVVDEGGALHIVQGRHPTVERLRLPGGFIPNDTRLDLETNRLHVLTGPNMAGKSTYLRQVALITLMAQMGSFVPAQSAKIGLVDRIFTRVGASDDLAAGQSTFMVEMTETAQILNCATARSLILLDEVGRGTSTYDGLSIAWAVTEHIHDRSRLGARTLFATHYHEMTQLGEAREGIKNYRVAVSERDGEVLFLRKIVEGGADRSYGIHVAQLAGLPPTVIDRAREVLAQLEQSSDRASVASPLSTQPSALSTSSADPTLPLPHPFIEEVRQMDLFSMTPLEALNRLAEIQRRIEREASEQEAR